MDLALNNLQRLICHKTQPTNHIYIYIYNYDTPVGTTRGTGYGFK